MVVVASDAFVPPSAPMPPPFRLAISAFMPGICWATTPEVLDGPRCLPEAGEDRVDALTVCEGCPDCSCACPAPAKPCCGDTIGRVLSVYGTGW